VEINANPHRLDLDWREVKGFLERGGWVSINPDAHRIEGLQDMEYGVAIARKGWATREQVMNVLSVEDLLEFVAARREQRRASASKRKPPRLAKSAPARKAVTGKPKGGGKPRRRS
jgi:DNA polymerase (family 10)